MDPREAHAAPVASRTAEADVIFSMLMGDAVERGRKFIEITR